MLIGEISDLADREVHPIFAELVATTADPFVQTIVDVIVPQTVFGRVMLLTPFRQSAVKAAEWADGRAASTPFPAIRGKRICVTGKFSDYHGSRRSC